MHLVATTRKTIEEAPGARPAANVQQPGLADWLLSHWKRWQRGPRPARRHMRVVEHLTLGGKRQLLLVEIAGERFLVGGGAESVDSIVRVRPETRSKVTPISPGECR